MAVLLALVAATVYGAADFYGGIASRRNPAATVVVLSQFAGIVVLAIAWVVLPGKFYPSDVGFGIAAGFAGSIAIAALYAALAVGRMGVVSPITAVVGASVPVVFGFVTGERPTWLALVGVACAFAAVALVSADARTKRISLAEPGVVPALVSGIAIGALFVLLGYGHADAGLARLAITRAASICLLLAYALVRRERLRPAPGSLRIILIAGALDMLANVLYISATHVGLLAIVAVLTSLYPASTVFLARVVLHERLSRSQWVGVGLAACGIACIAI
ncbi:MAG: DMT family transporter [Vulcanimicrobiaceae bacterium]